MQKKEVLGAILSSYPWAQHACFTENTCNVVTSELIDRFLIDEFTWSGRPAPVPIWEFADWYPYTGDRLVIQFETFQEANIEKSFRICAELFVQAKVSSDGI